MSERCLKTKAVLTAMPKRVLILASGNGSNFEAIVKYFQGKGLDVAFELLCDKKDAYVFKRAKKLGVPSYFVEFESLYDFLNARKGKYNLYVLAGFMRILPEKILKICAGSGKFYTDAGCCNIVNIHPTILPKFKGKDAIKRAFEAKEKKTGVTVHFVNRNVDSGWIIEQKSFDTKGLSFTQFEDSIHKIEHKMYPEIIENLLFKKRVLILGGGARENALAANICNSPYLEKLYLAGANDGFKHLGETVDFTGYKELLEKSLALKIDLLVVGAENPLCEGIADIFAAKGIKVIGANKAWARLEGSKSFAKEFMLKNGIKTADYKIIDYSAGENRAAFDDAFNYFLKKAAVPVIKADGLALGKGVCIAENINDAKLAASEFLAGKFGSASKKILLEERLFGREVSVISLWDGKTLASFPPASDYKRLLDGNNGVNTGGMGAYAPSNISARERNQIKKYLKTLEMALLEEKADFCGVVYSGLILTKDGVQVLEYNMRFGDPECQVLLELLENDLLSVFLAMTQKRLFDVDLKFRRKKAYCLVLASDGYPESPKKGAEIFGLNEAAKFGCKLYFAGVKALPGVVLRNFNPNHADKKMPVNENTKKLSGLDRETFENLLTNGGRVLNIVKSGSDDKKTLDDIYKAAQVISFDGKIYRKDIGKC